jgi:hypothetical protein
MQYLFKAFKESCQPGGDGFQAIFVADELRIFKVPKA